MSTLRTDTNPADKEMIMAELLTKEEWSTLPKDDPRLDISYFMEIMSQDQFDILFKDEEFPTNFRLNKIISTFKRT